MLADALGWEASALVHGPTPVPEAFARCNAILKRLHGNPWAEALVHHQVASLHAMRGEFDRAFALLDAANAVLATYAPTVDAAVSDPEVFVSMLAREPGRAERHLRAGRRQLEAMGERAVLASTEAMLGIAVFDQGRHAEADRLARRSARLATDGDISAQAFWRRVHGLVLAERGRVHDAERFVREAVALTELTDCLNDRAAALEDLARVRDLAGNQIDAASARDAALELYRRKGNIASCVRLEATLTLSASG
jgi:tetratricopeptide (TPR) repeat protein